MRIKIFIELTFYAVKFVMERFYAIISNFLLNIFFQAVPRRRIAEKWNMGQDVESVWGPESFNRLGTMGSSSSTPSSTWPSSSSSTATSCSSSSAIWSSLSSSSTESSGSSELNSKNEKSKSTEPAWLNEFQNVVSK